MNQPDMWSNRQHVLDRIADRLAFYSGHVRYLPGISNPKASRILCYQILASIRREDYYVAIQKKSPSSRRADPHDEIFDPERAVVHHVRVGNIDEAAWLIFLMTCFSKPVSYGWQRLQDVYGKLGHGVWDWQETSQDYEAFRSWLDANWRNIGGRFGSHRKYETLNPAAPRSFSSAVAGYLAWIGTHGHQKFLLDAVGYAGNDPTVIFDYLFRTMNVVSFGRLGRLDYLAMIGRYSLAPISPGSAYLGQSTGPARGARLLFLGSRAARARNAELQSYLDELDSSLKVGMLVIEDALCNWQKSPTSFVHFKG